VRAQAPSLARSHGRADAVCPRLVAGRHHHTGPNDHRAASQPWVVALLDRSEEGIHISVQDRRLVEHERMFAPNRAGIKDSRRHWYRQRRKQRAMGPHPMSQHFSFDHRSRVVAAQEEGQMASGTVKWFNDEKGFGFISPDDGSKDLFVHQSAIAGEGFRSVNEGDKVTYDEEASDKGPRAVNVQTV
jgi:CspA family cold shock protein